MKEIVYIDRLFADYESTPEIKDFKEEIAANLKERINGLEQSGMPDDLAFEKATAELGDITAIADAVGRKKRNEAIGQMYLNEKVPITKRTAIGVTVASGLFMTAVGIALITFFSQTVMLFLYYISAALLSGAAGLCVYSGLTQETAAHYPMNNKRALVYGVISSFGLLGTGIAAVMFFFTGYELYAVVLIKALFIVPAACVLVYLLVTEPKRQKPWFRAMIKKNIENNIVFHLNLVDPVKAVRFGIISGGLWFFAIALFIALGVLFSWQYAWLVLPFMLAVQTMMVSTIFVKSSKPPLETGHSSDDAMISRVNGKCESSNI